MNIVRSFWLDSTQVVRLVWQSWKQRGQWWLANLPRRLRQRYNAVMIRFYRWAQAFAAKGLSYRFGAPTYVRRGKHVFRVQRGDSTWFMQYMDHAIWDEQRRCWIVDLDDGKAPNALDMP